MLNFAKKGTNLAIITGDEPLKNEVVSVITDEITDKTYKSYKLEKKNKFQQIPNKKTERSILYITGASGSGKSYYIREYVKQYQKIFKNNEVYLYSYLNEDDTIDQIPNLHRIKIDQSLITHPLTASEFENSMVIFDDIDVINHKDIRNAIIQTANEILEVGRHYKISCCFSYHRPTGGRDTTRILNEATSITYFPHSGSQRSLNYLLIDYLGLTKKDIKRIKDTGTRWATIFVRYPQIVLTERLVYVLAHTED
jgi:hypothetical protein